MASERAADITLTVAYLASTARWVVRRGDIVSELNSLYSRAEAEAYARGYADAAAMLGGCTVTTYVEEVDR